MLLVFNSIICSFYSQGYLMFQDGYFRFNTHVHNTTSKEKRVIVGQSVHVSCSLKKCLWSCYRILFFIYVGQNLLSWSHIIARKTGELSLFREALAQLKILMEWILGRNSFCHTLFEPWWHWKCPCCKNYNMISSSSMDLSRLCMIIATSEERLTFSPTKTYY